MYLDKILIVPSPSIRGRKLHGVINTRTLRHYNIISHPCRCKEKSGMPSYVTSSFNKIPNF